MVGCQCQSLPRRSCKRCRWELSPRLTDILIAMNSSPSSLDRFIRRVYRRLVLLRLAEWAGVGFALGCALALPAILMLRSRPESPMAVAAVLIGAGAAGGFIAALLRRPRIMDAAVEADRQLDLADLLATAWQLEKSPAIESFEEAVLLIANQRAANLQPRSVVLQRLGLRAWSGIGLAGALVLTVAIFSANPIDSEASSSAFFPQAASNKQLDSKNSRANSDLSTGHHPATIAQDHPGEDDQALPGAGKTTDTAINTGRGQNTDTQTSNPNGTGPGAGQSISKPDKSNPLTTGTDSSRANIIGTASSGVGNSTDNGNGTSGNSTSTSTGNSNKSPSAPAWKADSWPTAQQAADSAISTGQIPPAYHDLVREYFKR
jgi:hypothetical protein